MDKSKKTKRTNKRKYRKKSLKNSLKRKNFKRSLKRKNSKRTIKKKTNKRTKRKNYKKQRGGSDDAENCSICQGPLGLPVAGEAGAEAGVASIVITTECGHRFHKDCLLGWVNSLAPNSLNCPVCRGGISSNSSNVEQAREYIDSKSHPWKGGGAQPAAQPAAAQPAAAQPTAVQPLPVMDPEEDFRIRENYEIIGVQLVDQEKIGGTTYYKIKVTAQTMSPQVQFEYEVFRRYSYLHSYQQEISARIQNCHDLFPEKTWWGQGTPENRYQELEGYLNCINNLTGDNKYFALNQVGPLFHPGYNISEIPQQQQTEIEVAKRIRNTSIQEEVTRREEARRAQGVTLGTFPKEGGITYEVKKIEDTNRCREGQFPVRITNHLDGPIQIFYGHERGAPPHLQLRLRGTPVIIPVGRSHILCTIDRIWGYGLEGSTEPISHFEILQEYIDSIDSGKLEVIIRKSNGEEIRRQQQEQSDADFLYSENLYAQEVEQAQQSAESRRREQEAEERAESERAAAAERAAAERAESERAAAAERAAAERAEAERAEAERAEAERAAAERAEAERAEGETIAIIPARENITYEVKKVEGNHNCEPGTFPLRIVNNLDGPIQIFYNVGETFKKLRGSALDPKGETSLCSVNQSRFWGYGLEGSREPISHFEILQEYIDSGKLKVIIRKSNGVEIRRKAEMERQAEMERRASESAQRQAEMERQTFRSEDRAIARTGGGGDILVTIEGYAGDGYYYVIFPEGDRLLWPESNLKNLHQSSSFDQFGVFGGEMTGDMGGQLSRSDSASSWSDDVDVDRGVTLAGVDDRRQGVTFGPPQVREYPAEGELSRSTKSSRKAARAAHEKSTSGSSGGTSSPYQFEEGEEVEVLDRHGGRKKAIFLRSTTEDAHFDRRLTQDEAIVKYLRGGVFKVEIGNLRPSQQRRGGGAAHGTPVPAHLRPSQQGQREIQEQYGRKSLSQLKEGDTVFVRGRQARLIGIFDSNWARVSYGSGIRDLVEVKNLSSSPLRYVPYI